MPVTVFAVDEQDDVAIEVVRWVRLAEAVLAAEGIRRACELSLLFVDEAVMSELNERHMGEARPTDVLAFPIDEDLLEPGRHPDNGTTGPDRPPDEDLPGLLGDIVICPAVAARQAPEHASPSPAPTSPSPAPAIPSPAPDIPVHDGSVEDEIALLVVHGLLHVLGMDHAEPDETAAMQAKERSLLERFHRHG